MMSVIFTVWLIRGVLFNSIQFCKTEKRNHTFPFGHSTKWSSVSGFPFFKYMCLCIMVPTCNLHLRKYKFFFERQKPFFWGGPNVISWCVLRSFEWNPLPTPIKKYYLFECHRRARKLLWNCPLSSWWVFSFRTNAPSKVLLKITGFSSYTIFNSMKSMVQYNIRTAEKCFLLWEVRLYCMGSP